MAWKIVAKNSGHCDRRASRTWDGPRRQWYSCGNPYLQLEIEILLFTTHRDFRMVLRICCPLNIRSVTMCNWSKIAFKYHNQSDEERRSVWEPGRTDLSWLTITGKLSCPDQAFYLAPDRPRNRCWRKTRQVSLSSTKRLVLHQRILLVRDRS
jgi:hypothetical protein